MAYMGCADGGTSIDMIGGALRYVRERAPSRPLTMTYTDLPRNDFSQVFQIVHGQTDIPAYAADIDNLFVFASGTSFHQRIFPVNSPQVLSIKVIRSAHVRRSKLYYLRDRIGKAVRLRDKRRGLAPRATQPAEPAAGESAAEV